MAAVTAGLATGGFGIVGGVHPETTRTPTTSVASAAAAAPSATTDPSATVGSSTATLAGSPPAPLPPTAPGLTRPGILLSASPASDGSFDVVERVRLANPVSALTLRPAPLDQAGRQFASASGTAAQVQVSAGERPVVVPGAKVEATMELPVGQADQFELRYRLTDVTVRSNPSPAGRALAAIGPLTGGVDDDLPVLFILSGGTVLGLSCPLLPLSQQSCGSRGQSGPSVERELPWRLALTTVQFDVPPT
jgi:hypothetical protein